MLNVGSYSGLKRVPMSSFTSSSASGVAARIEATVVGGAKQRPGHSRLVACLGDLYGEMWTTKTQDSFLAACQVAYRQDK